MNVYVGNLPFNITEDELRQAFEAFGQVSSSSIIKDKMTGQSRGFGFVEMPTDSEATAAIAGLNGKDLKGRALIVNEARPREERPRGDGGGRRPGGSGGYGDRDKRGGSSGGGKRRF